MVIFHDSSRTLNDQSVTLLRSSNEPLEKGVVLKVHPLGSSVPSSSSTTIPRPPSLSQWWVEASHELHDPTRKSSHVISRTFTLASNLHSAADHVDRFPLLGRRISAGEVQWALPSSKTPPLQYRGEFFFLPKYWEWLEDVLSRNTKVLSDANLYEPLLASLFTYDRNAHVLQAFLECWCAATNTLHTSVGEVSISLWDLHSIGGLPVYGSFYEEVVPNSKDLSSLPSCCRHLFAAFHHLSLELGGSHLVTTAAWVKFWFRGESKYQKPPTRRSIQRKARGKQSHNPFGKIDAPRILTKEDEAPFNMLKVEKRLIEETWLAALISCWLCEFALPNGGPNLIRPGVFKSAGAMARGRRYCLAVPVLANIYRGLNEIVSSKTPSKCDATFPAHYLNAWLAEYFDTHFELEGSRSKAVPRMFRYSGEGAAKHYDEVTARKLFHAVSSFKFHRLGLFKGHREILVDDDKLPSSYADYFISQRSSYLASRRGSVCIVEPYSPHRFGRQFGFNQHIPGELNEDFRTVTLEQVVCFWRQCLRLATNSKFLIPACPSEHGASCTKDYMNWWARRSDGFFSSKTEQPIGNVNPSKIRLKIKQPNEVVEPVKRRSDGKPSFGISEATNESLEGVCVDKAHSPKRGSSCMVSIPQDVEMTKGRDASGSEQNSGNSDSHWRHKRQRDNPSKNLDREGVTQAIDRGVDMDSLPDPSGGSAQVSLNSLFDDFDPEPIKDLCFLHDDLEAISGIQELFENDTLGILPMQDDNYPSKRAGEKCTPVATSPSTSEFSIQGPTAFDLATKAIDPSRSGKTNATPSFDPIHMPSRDVTRNKSIMCSSSIPTTSTITKFEPDDLILKADRQRAKTLGGDLIEKVVKTPFTLMTSLRDGVEKILQVIAQIKAVDAMPLRERISKYMDDANRYSSLHHALSQGIMLEDKEQKLTDARHRLALALDSEAIKSNQKVAIKANLDKALAREVELKKELELLSMQKAELTASSTRCDSELAQQQVIISQIKGEVSKIEATPTLEASDDAKLRGLQELLETSKEELRHLDWIG